MGQAEEVAAELTAAGFHDVRVERVAHPSDAPDLATFWGSLERTMAPLVLLRHRLGAEWAPIGARILASLSARFGSGPQSEMMPALLGIGRA